jgi:hypothetical protein
VPLYRARAEGAAFPAAPATNTRLYRTDRGIEYFYDGTRWLSVQMFELSFPTANSVSASNNYYLAVPFFGTYSLWLVDWSISLLRSAAGEWDIVLNYRNSANAGTVLDTRDGSADADAVFVAETRALAVALSANARVLQLAVNEISGAANANAGAVLHYRLIG